MHEDFERQFLRTVCASKMLNRIHGGRLEDSNFTSDARIHLFRLSHTVRFLSQEVIDIEAATMDPKKALELKAEWNYVTALKPSTDIETVIEFLEKEQAKKRMADKAEAAILAMDSGNLKLASSQFMQASMAQMKRRTHSSEGGLQDALLAVVAHMERARENPDQDGLKTGFAKFDRLTGGLFAEELTLLAGTTGLGKSTLARNLAMNVATLNDAGVLLIVNEESRQQVEMKLAAMMTSIPYINIKRGNVTDADIEKARLASSNPPKVYVREIPQFSTVALVEEEFRKLEFQGIDISLIVIDHLPHLMPMAQAYGENDERARAASDCKQLAKDLHCAVVVPTQAATEVEVKQTKGKRAGSLDVYGSKAQIHVANTFMIITDDGRVEDPSRNEWEWDHKWLIDIKKNRDGAKFYFRVKHRVAIGIVEEVTECTTTPKTPKTTKRSVRLPATGLQATAGCSSEPAS